MRCATLNDLAYRRNSHFILRVLVDSRVLLLGFGFGVSCFHINGFRKFRELLVGLFLFVICPRQDANCFTLFQQTRI